MPVKIAEAALRIRATGVDEARGKILKLGSTIQSAMRTPAGSERALAPLRQRIDLLAQAARQEGTKAEALTKLQGMESGLERALGRSNLSLAQRVKLEEQLRRVQAARAAAAPVAPVPVMRTPAVFGKADDSAASRRIALLAEGIKLEGTRAASLAKLAGVESGLTRALERGNLTLAQRVRLEGQLRRVQALRAPTPVPPVPPPAGGIGVRGVLAGTLGALGITAGIGAAAAGFRAMGDASDSAEAAQRKLTATSRLTGVALGAVGTIAATAGDRFKMGERQAADLTAEVVKLTTRAGQSGRSVEFMSSWLDLASANGQTLDDALQGLTTTLAGQDEGLNRLGLRNPTQIWASWGKQIGKTVAQMTDAEKWQAIVNEVVTQGAKVAGTYAVALESTAGRQQQLGKAAEDTAKIYGRALAPIRETLIGAARGTLEWAGTHVPLIAGITTATLAVGALTLAWKGFAAVRAAGGVAAILGGLTSAALLPVILTIGALAAAIGTLVWWQQRGKAAAEEWKESIRVEADQLSQTQILATRYRDLAKQIDSGKIKGEALAKAQRELKTVTDQLIEISPEYADLLRKEGVAASTTADEIQKVVNARYADVRAQMAQAEAEVARVKARAAGAQQQSAIMGMTGPTQAFNTQLKEAEDRLDHLRKMFPQFDSTRPLTLPAVVVTPPKKTAPADDDGGDPKKRAKAIHEEVEALAGLREMRELTASEAARATMLERALREERDRLTASTTKTGAETARLLDVEKDLAKLRTTLGAEIGTSQIGATAVAVDSLKTSMADLVAINLEGWVARSSPRRLVGEMKSLADSIADLMRELEAMEKDDANGGVERRMRQTRALLQSNLDAKKDAELAGLALGEALGQTFIDTISGFFQRLGETGSIGEAFKSLGASLLGGLGSAIKQFGVASLKASAMMAALRAAFKSLNPAGMAIAAIGMIALGSFLEGAAAGAMGGGGSRGGGGGSGIVAFDDRTERVGLGTGRVTAPVSGVVQPSGTSAGAAMGRAAPAPTPITMPILAVNPADPATQRLVNETMTRAGRRNL